jgi:hypothetical protein
MRRIAAALAAFAIAGTVASATPGAAAAPMAQHVVGDDCIGADIGLRDVASTGQAIICDSNYRWEPYRGQTPNDPWVAAQH